MQSSLETGLYAAAETETDRRLMARIAAQGKQPCPTDPSKPHVALVVGPSPFTMMRGWEYYLAAPYEGVTYIASVLHNAGYPVRIVDVRFAVDPLREAFDAIGRARCDVVGISTYEDCYPWTEELVALLKEARPETVVVLGGSLVTSVPHVFMAHTRADVAVISEGEITIIEVMEALTEGSWPRRLAEIRGIWYRGADGQVHQTPPRGQAADLDWLPTMNMALWPQARGPRGLQRQFIASHSRGCRRDCSFCFRTTPQLREKSVARFREEMHTLKRDYAMDFLFFSDLTFTSDKRRTLALCDVIGEVDIRWTCMTRCTDVDPEILAAMRRAGCDLILYGVESLSAECLHQARKGSSEHVVQRALELTEAAGIRFGALFILGLPGETETSLEHACRWAEEHRNIVRVKYLSAMPGTTVYREGLASGIIRGEVEHLRWLSIEQGLVTDEYLNYNNLPDVVTRRAFQRIYACYNAGSVLNYQHQPKNSIFYYPDPNQTWRNDYSIFGRPPVPGWERFRDPRLTPTADVLRAVTGEAVTTAWETDFVRPQLAALGIPAPAAAG